MGSDSDLTRLEHFSGVYMPPSPNAHNLRFWRLDCKRQSLPHQIQQGLVCAPNVVKLPTVA